jgi:oligopeptidase B
MFTVVLMQEWGNPAKEEYYYYMKSYSPQDNVRNHSALIVLHETKLPFLRVLYFNF